MKNIRSFAIAFAVALVSFTTVNANNIEVYKGNGDSEDAIEAARALYTELRGELVNFIQNPDLKGNDIHEGEVFIQFKVNDNKEIEVLKTLSNNTYLAEFVKENLESQVIETDRIEQGENYSLKIKFELR